MILSPDFIQTKQFVLANDLKCNFTYHLVNISVYKHSINTVLQKVNYSVV